MTSATLGRALLRAACIGALGALGACGDDDGVGIFSQQRDIAGTWVRVDPGAVRVAEPATFHDTLVLWDDGTGRWSRENEFADIFPPARTVLDVALDARGSALFLHITDISICIACGATARAHEAPGAPTYALLIEPPARPRSLSMIPGPHYRIRRTHAEALVVEEPVSTERRRYFYRRVTREYRR